MNCVRNIFSVLAAAALCAFPLVTSAVITNPTPQRSYVSLQGSDANNCGAAAPCRTWQAALAQTQSGGEILTLNSGGYGTLNITQAVSLIIPPGVYGGMSPPGGIDGIVINAAGSKVVLKGVSIKGQGGSSSPSSSGINIQAAGDVVIEDAIIENMTVGILASSPGALEIRNSKISGNFSNGIDLAPTGVLGAAIKGSTITANNGDGVHVSDYVVLDLKNSNLSLNNGWGLSAVGTLIPAGSALNIGIDAQNSDFAYNFLGGISFNDTSSQVAATATVVGFLEHDDFLGGGTCINAIGSAEVVLAWDTAHCPGNSALNVAATALAYTHGNNILKGTSGGVTGTLTTQTGNGFQ